MKLPLTLLGCDSWSRSVYEDGDGRLDIDTDPCTGHPPRICTKYQNTSDTSEDTPVNAEIAFVPCRERSLEG